MSLRMVRMVPSDLRQELAALDRATRAHRPAESGSLNYYKLN
jgi:hypothetical protein